MEAQGYTGVAAHKQKYQDRPKGMNPKRHSDTCGFGKTSAS
jgi:hypothetical protein